MNSFPSEATRRPVGPTMTLPEYKQQKAKKCALPDPLTSEEVVQAKQRLCDFVSLLRTE